MFFDFSSAFNTIQPPILTDKLLYMCADPHLTSWIIEYLTARPQYVRMGRFSLNLYLTRKKVPLRLKISFSRESWQM